MGNAAVVVKTAREQATIIKEDSFEDKQIGFIVHAVEMAKSYSGDSPTGMEPLVIKKSGLRIPTGMCDLIEVHGFYSTETAEHAIFRLKDTGVVEAEAITELVKNKSGMVTAIKFMSPKLRLRYKPQA